MVSEQNLHDRLRNGPKPVTNVWIDWYLTFITHVNINSIVMWVILQNNADWDCTALWNCWNSHLWRPTGCWPRARLQMLPEKWRPPLPGRWEHTTRILYSAKRWLRCHSAQHEGESIWSLEEKAQVGLESQPHLLPVRLCGLSTLQVHGEAGEVVQEREMQQWKERRKELMKGTEARLSSEKRETQQKQEHFCGERQRETETERRHLRIGCFCVWVCALQRWWSLRIQAGAERAASRWKVRGRQPVSPNHSRDIICTPPCLDPRGSVSLASDFPDLRTQSLDLLEARQLSHLPLQVLLGPSSCADWPISPGRTGRPQVAPAFFFREHCH